MCPFNLLHDAAGSQLVALHFLHLISNMSLEKNDAWKLHNAFLYNSRTAGSGLSGASKETNEMKRIVSFICLPRDSENNSTGIWR